MGIRGDENKCWGCGLVYMFKILGSIPSIEKKKEFKIINFNMSTSPFLKATLNFQEKNTKNV